MKIAVIGSGRIGSSVGTAWVEAGHDVIFGVRNPQNVNDLPSQAMSISDAVNSSDVVFFAIPGRAMIETIKELDLNNKIIVDATNGGDTPESTVVQSIANLFPSASVTKAFNTLGYENFLNPNFRESRADLLYVGSERDKQVVEQLIEDVGLNPVYVGDLDQMKILDAGMRFWFAFSGKFGRHVAFKVLID